MASKKKLNDIILASVIVAGAGGMSCNEYEYAVKIQDKTDYDETDKSINSHLLEHITNTTFEILVENKFHVTKINHLTQDREHETITKYSGGSGVVVDKNYFAKTVDILTCDHLNMADDVLRFRDGFFETIIEPVSKRYYMVRKYLFSRLDPVLMESTELYVHKADESKDLMLLRSKELRQAEFNWFNSIATLAEDTAIQQGDLVYTIGFPSSLGKQLAKGIITGTGNKNENWDDNIIYTDATIGAGCSGGPAFVFSKGRAYLAGINQLAFRNQAYYGLIRPKVIKEFFGGL